MFYLLKTWFQDESCNFAAFIIKDGKMAFCVLPMSAISRHAQAPAYGAWRNWRRLAQKGGKARISGICRFEMTGVQAQDQGCDPP